MKTILECFEADARPLIESAEGYLSLGMLDMADAEIQRAIGRFGESDAFFEIKRSIASARGDYEMLASLTRANLDNSRDPAADLHVVSLFSDPNWVYSRCIAFETGNQKDYLYWYNRACFACRVGNFRDALDSLKRGLSLSSNNHAVAFVDADLEPLWAWILDVRLDDDIAEWLAHPIWRQVIATQAGATEEIELSPSMKSIVPEPFRNFLVPSQFSIRASEKIPIYIYREYLEWQKAVAQLRVDALNCATGRARIYLTNRQPRFALRKINQGNPTAARYHLLHYLKFQSQQLSRLQCLENLGMSYFLNDIAPAIAEDASFIHKMQSVLFPGQSRQSPKEILEEVSPIGKETTLYQARLASEEIADGQEREGICRLLKVIERWPGDAFGYSRLVDAYIRLERWEEVRLCFQAAPAHYRQFHRYREQWQQIKEESTEVVDAGPPMDQFVGQRDLGGLLITPETSGQKEGE